MDVYIYDEGLNRIAIVDNYRSLIWANRYWETGDCELYLPASVENFNLLKINRFIGVDGDDTMLCIIKKVEIDTSYENGDYIIITGLDCKSWLDQRIVWGTLNADGKAELFIRSMVNTSIGSGALAERQITNNGTRLVELGTAQGFSEVLTEQISYQNIGAKIKDYCRKYGWGYRLRHDGNKLKFEIYAGTDRHETVVFSDQFENLISTAYIEDETKQGNVAMTAGAGEGSQREKTVSGEAASVDRYEIFVDARDVSRLMTYDLLTSTYGGGTIVSAGDYYEYELAELNLQIIDASHLAWLQAHYTGSIVTIAGVQYYRMLNIPIASLDTATPDSLTTVTLYDVIYTAYLITRGYNRLAEFGKTISFSGSVEPRSTFKYREDFQLGDIVTIANQYGISVQARITEVIEVEDDNGYQIEPRFVYIELDTEDYGTYLEAEDQRRLLSEDGEGILVEESVRSAGTRAASGVKISELPEAESVADTDEIPIASEGVTKKLPYSVIRGALNAKTIPYGYCTTAAGTKAKKVDVSPAITELVTGMQILVKFQYTSTVADATLSVNGLTAKAIKRYGTTGNTTTAAGGWQANSVLLLVYDGSYWQIVAYNNTTYSAMTQSEATTGTATTGRTITAKVLHDTIVGLINAQ